MDDDSEDLDEDESMDDSNDSSPPPSLPRRGKGRSSSTYPLKNERKTPKKTRVSLSMMASPEAEASCKKPPR